MLYEEHLQYGQWKDPFWVIEVVQGVESFLRLLYGPRIDDGGKFPILVEFCNTVQKFLRCYEVLVDVVDVDLRMSEL